MTAATLQKGKGQRVRKVSGGGLCAAVSSLAGGGTGSWTTRGPYQMKLALE